MSWGSSCARVRANILFLDAGKPCSDDGDCDSTYDEALMCRDFSERHFCSRPCDGDFGPLVCREGFYRLPSDVPLPSYADAP